MRAGLALAFLIGTALPAVAAEGFEIVIPGRPGVPIIINGVDASYAVVEGEWGLGKNYQPPVTVYGGHPVEPEPPVGHYYPTLGHAPGYGRLEIEPPPNRVLPKPAESYHQSWSAQSAPPQAQQPLVSPYPPAVVVAPQSNYQDQSSEQNRRPPRATPRPLSSRTSQARGTRSTTTRK
ncbi:hypothetical protein [Bradyrhizobium sp. dw_78]|uniref:hypothetical protein n=1 Tax=Bradyrhizobium sp. dw_78 TaxID=2719793 RepID=UPI00201BC119|nr:hypothetical protein [Bradyrhizobium sp. dw_78]